MLEWTNNEVIFIITTKQVTWNFDSDLTSINISRLLMRKLT